MILAFRSKRMTPRGGLLVEGAGLPKRVRDHGPRLARCRERGASRVTTNLSRLNKHFPWLQEVSSCQGHEWPDHCLPSTTETIARMTLRTVRPYTRPAWARLLFQLSARAPPFLAGGIIGTRITVKLGLALFEEG